MKLSKAQHKVLEKLSEGSNYLLYMDDLRNRNNYWFFAGDHEHVRCSTVNKLLKERFVTVQETDKFGRHRTARISHCGMVYIYPFMKGHDTLDTA